MRIRRAEKKDTAAVLRLLSQVLDLHAALRPDIFVPGTTKYTADELTEIFQNDETPVYLAVDERDVPVGYAFCVLREQPFHSNMVPFRSFFIDDLCVDREQRGRGIGEALFRFAREEAARRGCYEITLNVWEGNDAAKRFYEKMGMRVKQTQMECIL